MQVRTYAIVFESIDYTLKMSPGFFFFIYTIIIAFLKTMLNLP